MAAAVVVVAAAAVDFVGVAAVAMGVGMEEEEVVVVVEATKSLKVQSFATSVTRRKNPLGLYMGTTPAIVI